MKKIIMLLLLIPCVSKPAAGSEVAYDWMGNPLPIDAQRNLVLASEQELTKRLDDKGLFVLVGPDLVKKFAGTKTSAMDVNSDILNHLLEKMRGFRSRRRSIVNCLLQEHPLVAQKMWQDEDKVYKWLGIGDEDK